MRLTGLRLASCGAVLLVGQTAVAATKIVQVGPNGALVFAPAAVTVNVGDTVEWQWAAGFHSTTRDEAPDTWDSGAVNTPHTFSHTFTQPGTFDFYCSVHKSLGMTGTVTVRPAAVTTTTIGAASSTCTSISACEVDLGAALPAPGAAANAKQRRVAVHLQALARRAAHQLDRAVAASGARQTRLFKLAGRTLERLRTAAANAEAHGNLVVPLGPVDADLDSLESLGHGS